MKSKVQFDLDWNNNSVILAKVELSDDVRDKIAQGFRQQFHHSSNLCAVRFDLNVPGELTLVPLSGIYDEVQKQVWQITPEQMSQLLRVFAIELGNRGIGVDWEHLTKEHGTAQENHKKNSELLVQMTT